MRHLHVLQDALHFFEVEVCFHHVVLGQALAGFPVLLDGRQERVYFFMMVVVVRRIITFRVVVSRIVALGVVVVMGVIWVFVLRRESC